MERSPRNKTLSLSESEGERLLSKCVTSPPYGIDCTVLGDCIDIMDSLPDGFADLIIADPPYNMHRKFGDSVFSKMPPEEYAEYTARWIACAARLLKEGGSMYVCCDWSSGLAVFSELSRHLTVKNRITWQREKGRGSKTNWKSCHEDIYYAVKGCAPFHAERVMQRRRVLAPYRSEGVARDWEDTRQGKFRNTYPSNLWDDITVPFWSMEENTPHPTQKPEKLVAKMILASSNEGDIVFDPFLGSGTSSVVAKKLKRHYFGIEKCPKYAAYAEYRLEKAERDPSIQGYDGVFFERNSAPVKHNK